MPIWICVCSHTYINHQNMNVCVCSHTYINHQIEFGFLNHIHMRACLPACLPACMYVCMYVCRYMHVCKNWQTQTDRQTDGLMKAGPMQIMAKNFVCLHAILKSTMGRCWWFLMHECMHVCMYACMYAAICTCVKIDKHRQTDRQMDWWKQDRCRSWLKFCVFTCYFEIDYGQVLMISHHIWVPHTHTYTLYIHRHTIAG